MSFDHQNVGNRVSYSKTISADHNTHAMITWEYSCHANPGAEQDNLPEAGIVTR